MDTPFLLFILVSPQPASRSRVCVRTFIKIPGSVKIFYDYFIITSEEISKPETIIEIDLLNYRIIIFILLRVCVA